ncbi:histone deacetylase family protein [Halorubrum cibi]|uniref:Acetoin utilization deacetylase AcuC n=1 Tax=Halorubrum cibi TaxID=413815 RepID=A0A521AIV6_9EURY|nr:histone deacetylase [Halorubrum cibi]SMO34697.1 Acetoin utilization deacetylase AcuC [Halorubrum cibi]
MRFGYSERCLDHDPGDRHPENPDRLRAIRRGLAKRHGVEYTEASPANREAVTAVHDDDYVAELEAFCADGGGNWDPDTVAGEGTWEAALSAAGLAQWAADAALDGENGRKTPFAIGRPPGHHAVTADAMGFCFFNNAAVAAESVLEAGRADRVAILDWDVHHGNGTQDIFYDRGDVLYASIHEDGLYPATGELTETGEGDGEGTTVNLPLAAGAGDADYLYAIDEAIEPALDGFAPDLVIVSAGFDAHRHDPISRMRVSSEGYALLTDRIRSVAEGIDAAVAYVLEGGYGLDTLAEGVSMVHETYDGRTPVDPDDDPSEKTESRVADLQSALGL